MNRSLRQWDAAVREAYAAQQSQSAFMISRVP